MSINRISVTVHNRQQKYLFSSKVRTLVTDAARTAFNACAGEGRLAFLRQLHKAIAAKPARGSAGRRFFAEASVTITDDAGIQEANKAFRGIDKPTDVLSFPLIDFTDIEGAPPAAYLDPQTGRAPIGEILISAERARAQATEYNHSFERELGFLTVHGMLHLLGYDHTDAESESTMRRLTEDVLSSMGPDIGGAMGLDIGGAMGPDIGGEMGPDIGGAPAQDIGGAPAHTAAGTAACKSGAYRSGFVAVLGKANVGKSTLTNTLIGAPLAIVTNKPQTTRRNARMILTTGAYQLVFVDTPGLHPPKNRLGEQMVRRAKASIPDADAIILMIDARNKVLGDSDREVAEIARASGTPVLLLINKIDLVSRESLLPLIADISAGYGFAAILPVSANKPETREIVLKEAVKLIPEGGPLYPDDMITDQTERQLVADIIREKALWTLSDEVPHGIDVEIDKYSIRERDGLYEIYATIYCERESHKKIILGKNGATLKKIGTSARIGIERMLAPWLATDTAPSSGKAAQDAADTASGAGEAAHDAADTASGAGKAAHDAAPGAGKADTPHPKVFLSLWVKVNKNWRDNNVMLRRMGYFEKQT